MGLINILNLDRNPATREARRAVLVQAEFRVVDAADRESAVAAFARAADHPLLVLLAGNSPDLLELAEWFKAHALAPVFVVRLAESGVSGPGAEPGVDTVLVDDCLRPDWLATLRAFAGLMERQAADRRCIEALRAELSEKYGTRRRLREDGSRVREPAASANLDSGTLAAAEASLSTESVQAILERIPALLAIVDAAGRVRFVNRRWTDTLGWNPADSIGRDVLPDLCPEPEYRAHLRDHLRNQPGAFKDFVVHSVDGRLLQAAWAGAALPDGGSVIVGLDVSGRRREEEALRFDRALFEALHTAAPVGIVFVSREYRYIRVNQTFSEITGLSVDRMLGRTVQEVVPDLWSRLEEVYRRVLEQGEVAANVELTGETLAQPGVRRYWLAHYYPLKVAGETVAAGAVIQEITAQKRTEEALRDSERRLELALSGADMGSCEWDLVTDELIIHDRWARIFGGAPEPIATDYEGWLSGVHPEDRSRVQDMWHAHLEGRLAFFEAEYRYQAPGQPCTWAMVRGRVVERDKPGKPLRAVGMYRDIGVRKVLEERLDKQREQILHVQRMTTAGALVAMVAHELNQPLGAIANYLGGAKLRFNEVLANHPPLAEALTEALRLSERASQVVKSIRDLVRRRDDEKDWVSLRELIHDSLLLAQAEFRKRQIRIILDVAPNLPPVWGQRVHLQQLLLNLALNAMEAMEAVPPERRELTIQAAVAAAGGIEILVTDRGKGLPPELAAQLFEPFVSDKPEGLGLGLSICRTIAESHGGLIEADPPRAVGATFRIHLPAGTGPLS